MSKKLIFLIKDLSYIHDFHHTYYYSHYDDVFFIFKEPLRRRNT